MTIRVVGSIVLAAAVLVLGARGLRADQRDAIYDPTADGLPFLQKLEQATDGFPRDRLGGVNWADALRRGLIAPRKGLMPNGQMSELDLNIRMSRTASMPNVTFPHLAHTQWLACTNCHPSIFLPKKDANPITMYAIVSGEYCGVCHGKVAFPISDCFRCHDTPKEAGARQ